MAIEMQWLSFFCQKIKQQYLNAHMVEFNFFCQGALLSFVCVLGLKHVAYMVYFKIL